MLGTLTFSKSHLAMGLYSTHLHCLELCYMVQWLVKLPGFLQKKKKIPRPINLLFYEYPACTLFQFPWSVKQCCCKQLQLKKSRESPSSPSPPPPPPLKNF